MRGKEGFSLGKSPLGRPRVAYTLRLYNYLLRFYLILKLSFNFLNLI